MSDAPNANPEKPTEDWVTGDEPMTGPQESYLRTLAREAGVEVPDGLTKARASEMIDHLQGVTGRRSATEPADGSSGREDEFDDPHALARRVEAEGIVDQQAMALDDEPGDA